MGRSQEFDLGNYGESLDLRTGPRPGREGMLEGELDYRGTLQERLEDLRSQGRVGVAKGYPRNSRALSLTDDDTGPYGVPTPREQRHLVLHHWTDTHDVKALENPSRWHREQHERGLVVEPHHHRHQGHNLGLTGDERGTHWDG